MPNPSEFLGASASGPSGLEGGAAASMAATKTTQDPSDLLYKGESVLGKPTTVQTPGTVGEPLSAGLAAAPVTGGPVGAAGGVEGAGGVGGEIGPSVLQLVQQSLGIAGKSSDLLGRLRNDDNAAINNQVRGMLAGGLTPFNVPSDVLSGASGGSVGAFDLANAKPFDAAAGLASQEGIGSAAGGATSGLGAAAGGAGLGAAILGLIASLTGNKDIGTAASGLGAGATAAGTAGTLGAAGTGVAGTGASTALGATGSAAGVLAAPIIATLLLDQFMGPKDGGLVGQALAKTQGNYPTFAPELMQNVGQQGQAFQTLAQALPYVQSKEELGQLLNSYKNYVGTTTGIGLEDRSGTGDPYRLSAIPGVGARTHGQATPPTDFGPQEQELQGAVDRLLGILPGERITAAYGQPGGGLEGEPARRLWQQFMLEQDRPKPDLRAGTYEGSVYGAGPRSAQDITNAVNAGTIGDNLAWDPATGQWVLAGAGNGPPKPGDYFQQSPYWAQLLQGAGGGAAPAAGTPGAGPGAIGEQIDELMRAAARGQ